MESELVKCSAFNMVRHLPPRIKQLLTTQNPDAYLGPSVTQLNRLFQKTWNDATLKGTETGWLVLAVRIAISDLYASVD